LDKELAAFARAKRLQALMGQFGSVS